MADIVVYDEIYRQVGQKTEAPNENGSIHAKLGQMAADIKEIIATKGPVTATNTLRASADTARSSSSTEIIKLKEVQMFVRGRVRVSFEMRKTSDGPAVHGEIRKNGVGVNAFTTNNTAYETFTTDVAVDEFDKVQLFGRVGAGTENTGSWRYFRIKYDHAESEYAIKED